MISDRNGTLDMSRGFFELKKHDTCHRDIGGVLEVEGDVEVGGAILGRCNPIFLIFSVWDLTVLNCSTSLNLEERPADWSTDKVALELSNLSCNFIHSRVSLHSDSFIVGSDGILFLLTHALLDFGGLWEVCSRNGESDIPIWHPLVTWQAIVGVLLLKHLIATILEDHGGIVTFERVKDLRILGITSYLVYDIIEVVSLLTVGEIFL